MIDAHVHFWRPALGHDILILRREAALRRDFLPADLAPALAAAGVARAVVVQSAPQPEETRFLLALAADVAWVAGVVGWVDLAAPDAGAALDAFARAPKFRGVRVMLHRIDDPGWIARDDVGHGLAELARRGLSLDLIARAEHLAACRAALARRPGLRAIVNHGGGPPIAGGGWEPWASGIAALARDTGAFCKFSGLLEEAGPDCSSIEQSPAAAAAALARHAGHLAACFGPDRLVWASNWPVCELVGGHARWRAVALALIDRLGLPRDALLGANARRAYALDPD